MTNCGFIVALCVSAQVWAAPKLMTQPLGFERNDGQTASEVRYFSRGPASTLFLTASKAVLSFQGASLEMALQGANPAARIEGVDRAPGAANYFIGADSSRWRSSIPRYARVRYSGVYPGIDLVYYGNGQKLEYDFVVAPGADPRSIRMAYGGADSVRIDTGGVLVIGVAGREVLQQKPVIYQDRNGRREILHGHYVLDGQTVRFEVAKYDPAHTLVIDPALSFSTYLGGSQNDEPTGIASDSSGNIYVTGWTDSPDFPTTAGAYLKNSGERIAYVSKISPDGTKLVYSTFLGTSASQTYSYAIVVNKAGEAFIAGSGGTGFPTTAGAYGTASQGSAYVAKLSADGSKLMMSTMIRGGNEQAYALAIDSAGAAYVTGYGGGQLVTTAGAYQTRPAGGGTGFIAKVAADGKSAGYVTYFDGNEGVDMSGIAVDSGGNAYVTGTTRSTDLKTTAGAAQINPPTNVDSGFVFKMNPTGSAVVWGTYLGGKGQNTPSGITIDSAGSVYVLGQSELDGPFPTTAGSYKTKSCTDQCMEAWLVKYNPQGGVVFSTLLGDITLLHKNGSYPGGISPAVDPNGNIYIVGDTSGSSTDEFVGTADAFKRTLSGADRQQIVIARLDATGSSMPYATFYGGTGDEYALGIAVDSCGSIYITGQTDSTDLPVTSGAVQSRAPGTFDKGYTSFVAKFLQPFFTPAGVVNAASYVSGKVAPGEIVSIFGCDIGPETPVPYHLTNNTFDNLVNQTRVLFDGVAAPIIFAWKDQTSVVVPYTVAGKQTTSMVAEYRGIQSPQVTLPVANIVPGLFTQNATGSGAGAVLNSDYSLNRAGNGAARGDYIMVFGTIGGESGQDGVIVGGPLAHPMSNSVTATVGGVNAQVLYVGNAPGLIWGMMQLNLVIPSSVTPGSSVPLVLNIGGTQTQGSVTITVK